MLIEERRQKILKYIQKNGRATVAELSGYIYASEPTVRRDLTAMEKAGQIKKVYGGAMAKAAADREIPMDVRLKDALRAKGAYGAKSVQIRKRRRRDFAGWFVKRHGDGQISDAL